MEQTKKKVFISAETQNELGLTKNYITVTEKKANPDIIKPQISDTRKKRDK